MPIVWDDEQEGGVATMPAPQGHVVWDDEDEDSDPDPLGFGDIVPAVESAKSVQPSPVAPAPTLEDGAANPEGGVVQPHIRRLIERQLKTMPLTIPQDTLERSTAAIQALPDSPYKTKLLRDLAITKQQNAQARYDTQQAQASGKNYYQQLATSDPTQVGYEHYGGDGLIGDAGKGLLGSVVGAGTTITNLVDRTVGAPFGGNERANARNDATAFVRDLQRTDRNSTVGNLVQSASEMFADLGLLALTQLPFIQSIAAKTFDQTLSDNLRNDIEPTKATLHAAGSTALNVALMASGNKIATRLGVTPQRTLMEGLSKAATRLTTKEGMVAATKDILFQSTQEGIEQLSQNVYDYYTDVRPEALNPEVLLPETLLAGGMGGIVAGTAHAGHGALRLARDAYRRVQQRWPNIVKAVADAQSYTGDIPPTSRRSFEEATGREHTNKDYRDEFVENVTARLEDRRLPDEAPAETATATATPELTDRRLPDEAQPQPRPTEPLRLHDATEGPREGHNLGKRELASLARWYQNFRERSEDIDVDDLDWMMEYRPDYLQAVRTLSQERAANYNEAMANGRSEWKAVFGSMSAEKARTARKHAGDDGDTTFKGWDEIVDKVTGEGSGFVAYPEIYAAASKLGLGDIESGLFELLQHSSKYFANKTSDDFFAGALEEAFEGMASFPPADYDDEIFQHPLPQDGSFELSREQSPDATPIVPGYKVPDDQRLPPSRRKQRQPNLDGMPTDMDPGTLQGQQGLFRRANPRNPGERQEPFEGIAVEAAGEFSRTLRSVPLPAIVEVARNLLGKYPDVGGLRTALGSFSAKRRNIKITESLGKDPDLLARVLSHEIGHLADWLPDQSSARGSILGRIGSLNKHADWWLEGRPGGDKPLDDADRARLKEEAQRILTGELSETQVEVTPADILAIWNSLDQTGLPPGLVSYVKRATTAEKTLIVKAALKGVVPDEVQAAVRAFNNKPSNAQPLLNKKWNELIIEEIRKRELLSRETITDELIALTKWWSGDYEGTDDKYRAYRESSDELYAEAISVLLNSPGDLAQRAPEFFRGFSNWIGAKPEVFKEFMRIQDILAGTPESIAERMQYNVYDMFDRHEDKLRAVVAIKEANEKSATELVGNFLFQYQYDSVGPAKRLFPNGHTARYMLDELYTKDSPNEAFLSEVERTVTQPAVEAGLTTRDIGAYMFADRIANGDRNKVINPGGISPQYAQEQLDLMQRQLGPEKWQSLQSSVKAFHALALDAAENLYEAGGLSDVGIKTVRDAADHYAAYWVTEHVDSDFIPPAIEKQLGTFKEIGNPYLATILKVMGMNRLTQVTATKRVVFDRLKQIAPQDIRSVTLPYRAREPGEPAKPGRDYSHHLEYGKHVVYEVPTAIAKSFMDHDIGGLQRVAAVATSKTYALWYPLLVGYSAGFVAANPFRDFGRSLKALKGLAGRYPKTIATGDNFKVAAPRTVTMRELFQHSVNNFGVAYARASGRSHPKLETLYSEHVLGPSRFDVAKESAGKDYYERLMEKHGYRSSYSRNKAVRAGRKIAAFVDAIGVFEETVAKAAGYDILKEWGVPVKERAFIVRKQIGTPDIYQKGLATTPLQFARMFARVRLNGMVTDAELATGRDTAAGWWWTTAQHNVMPAVVKRLALYGALGVTAQAIMQQVSTGILNNYNVLPLGLTEPDEEGKRKGVYLTIPQDETGAMISTIVGNLMDAMVGGGPRNASTWESLQKAFGDLMGAVLPTQNPAINIADKWLRHGMGQNPVDTYTNRAIIPRAEFGAGGWPATKKMLAWTSNQFGAASQIARPLTDKAFGAPFRSESDKSIEFLTNIPGLSRLIRVTDAGLAEGQWANIRREKMAQSKFLMTLPPEVRDLTEERFLLMSNENPTGPQRARLDQLKRWHSTYLKYRKRIAYNDEHQNPERAAQLRKELGELTTATLTKGG